MKAIILERRGDEAAVLCEDGSVLRLRTAGEVGERVEVQPKVLRFPTQSRRILRTAVAAALILAVTGGTYTYTTGVAASYVTLDTESSSVEFSVNRRGQVIAVRALDESSEDLARAIYADVRRMPVEDAFSFAMTRFEEPQTVVAGVTGETEKKTADLQQAVERGAARGGAEGVELVTLEVSRAERREAGEQEMSAGRFAFERGGGKWRHEKQRSEEAAAESSDGTTARQERPAFAARTDGEAQVPADDAATDAATGDTVRDDGADNASREALGGQNGGQGVRPGPRNADGEAFPSGGGPGHRGGQSGQVPPAAQQRSEESGAADSAAPRDTQPQPSQQQSPAPDAQPQPSEQQSPAPDAQPQPSEQQAPAPDAQPQPSEQQSPAPDAQPQTPEQQSPAPDAQPQPSQQQAPVGEAAAHTNRNSAPAESDRMGGGTGGQPSAPTGGTQDGGAPNQGGQPAPGGSETHGGSGAPGGSGEPGGPGGPR